MGKSDSLIPVEDSQPNSGSALLDASRLLEEALEQMDGIISGTKIDFDQSTIDAVSRDSLKDAVDQICVSLEKNGLDSIPLSKETRGLFIKWLGADDKGNDEQENNSPVVEERLQRLEGDKNSLQMQVSVLTEQIDAQSEKIMELERNLDDRKDRLYGTEGALQRELLARSSLETQKLELLGEISNAKLHQAATEKENLELKNQLKKALQGIAVAKLKEEKNNFHHDKPPMIPRSPPVFSPTTSTPINSPLNNVDGAKIQMILGTSSAGSMSSLYSSPTHRNSYEDMNVPPPPRTPPGNSRHKIQNVMGGSLPRQQRENSSLISSTTNNTSQLQIDPPVTTVLPAKKAVAFGKGLFSSFPFRSSTTSGKRSSSAPNLAETERMLDETLSSNDISATPIPTSTANQVLGKPKGIKKIFGRLWGSSTDCLHGDFAPEGEFRRGGMRATAGGRLGWSNDAKHNKEPSSLPFSLWDTNALCAWLQDLGLGMYVSSARQWLKSGDQLLHASTHDYERELGIKHILHRKKLQLAVQSKSGKSSNQPDPKINNLDTPWVVRWLDDVGLPQYKESFLDARIDGRMLHAMTVDDARMLGVGSVLHLASLKRGIQVLRVHNFQPDCLRRRSTPEEVGQTPSLVHISLWTNHRVMEWLRAVDLAEYAPNLRGSGVHGSLLVLEDNFNADLLASLLSIPSGKTLLRRHLHTHVRQLLGSAILQRKREMEITQGVMLLHPTSKMKVSKRGQFSLRKKKGRNDFEPDELVCPLEDVDAVVTYVIREKTNSM